MPLSVLNVAYPLARVGEDSVGGAEQIVATLDASLNAAEHLSVIIACTGSAVRGVLLETPYPSGEISAAAVAQAQRRARELIENVQAAVSVDLIHMHGVDFWAYAPVGSGVPVIVTLHLPASWYPPSIFSQPAPNVTYVCVSETQRRGLPRTPAPVHVVLNGVDLARFAPCPGKEDFFVSLGRVCPEKNFHVALEAARRAKVRLRLAGAVFEYPSHRRYFEDEIRPRLDDARQFVGPIAAVPKRRLLAQARGLIVPATGTETSSLVAMEAMACGTPVIAVRQPALEEIVDHGRTGFLVDDLQGMVDAIARIDSIDPTHCRAVALERFSAARMARAYLELYESVATPRRRHRRSTDRVGAAPQ